MSQAQQAKQALTILSSESPFPALVTSRIVSLVAVLGALSLFSVGCDVLRELFGMEPTAEEMAEASYVRGQTLLVRGELDGAEEALRRTLSLNPQHGSATLHLARIYHERGEDSRALLELGSAEGLLPHSPEVFLLRGAILLGQGRYSQSAAAYRQAVGRGAPPSARRSMIVALVRAGEFEAARIELEALRGIAAHEPVFLSVEGLVLAGEGKTTQARSLLETAASAASDSEAPLALGWFLLHQGEPRGAISHLRTAASLGGDISVVRVLAEALIDAGESGEAAELVRPYTATRERDPLIHAVFARALVGQGRYQEALTSANRALRLDPRLAPALLARGAALEAAGDVESAIDSYRAASREAPGYTDAYRHLAGAYRRVGRNSDAMAALERLVAIDPSDKRGAFALLELYADTGVHAQRGLRLVTSLLDAEPGDPTLMEYRRRFHAQRQEEAPSRQRRPAPGQSRPQIIRGR